MTEFKLIVAGSRSFNNYSFLSKKVIELATEGDLKDYDVSIVSGMARGADALAVQFAKEHNVKLYEFPADWDTHGKSAGYLRNQAMGNFADGLLAFWDGKSRGTDHMISYMAKLRKPTHIIKY